MGQLPGRVQSSLPFGRFFLNTFLYCAVTIVGVCISSSLVAYGFSRLRWRGRNALFYVMLMTLLLPFVCTLIPLFILYKHAGWIDSYLPLEVPTFFGSSVFSTFLLRQFFMTIPPSLSDAARVDGAERVLHLQPDHPAPVEARHGLRDPFPVHLLLE